MSDSKFNERKDEWNPQKFYSDDITSLLKRCGKKKQNEYFHSIYGWISNFTTSKYHKKRNLLDDPIHINVYMYTISRRDARELDCIKKLH